jgi:hypothetical protein
LRVEVLSATRPSPQVLELRLAFVNHDRERSLELGHRFAETPGEAGTLSAAYVTTPAGTARYFVLRDSAGMPVGSGGFDRLAPGERRDAWVQFLSPGDAHEIALQIPGLPRISGIPVSAID